MRKAKNIFANIDSASIILYILLIGFGWLNIYASQFNDDTNFIIDFSSRYGKQLFFIFFSMFIAFLILIIDWKFFYSLAYIFYGIIIFALIILLIIGSVTSGATSWFEIGSFKFQPSEFAKFATALALAKYFNMQHIKNKKIQTKIVSYLLILVPFLLIILQNDTGTALVYSSFILVLYREGLSANILIFVLIIGILFILTLLIDKIILSLIFTVITLAILFFLRKNKKDIIMIMIGWLLSLFFIFSVNYIFNNILPPHQSKRINVLLGKDFDPYGAGYNLIQSKIAIGSGGFSGKGFLNGTQTRFDFVPEQSTDFIFCTIGEEWGFIGSLFFIITFMGLVIRLIFLSERQRSNFSRIYGYSVACILFAHFVINLGMTIGLIPVIGIPLPFVSYGGSSLLGFTILLFIFLNLDSYRLQILR
ncbi:MAG: rod shape-determining protein RodA [Flavobacteriales bacterium]|jgi:rod shape determining protein RodA|nr:rod shape-determining protein RodA [Flavobacteriales bacterium]|tara:strand:+ start:822 stop:2084 length:1263 start_codon:yes stop_codon:yes gene_type:complete